ncbi:MAG: alpha/beta hydrolase [Bacteroidetes bacterium]|nr:alpha/beta hydrolase [Bacteroidota bacterium]
MSDAEYSFLTDGDFTLPYKSYGSGDELLLCFHGFGRISDDFHRFEKELGHKYTLIAFDFLYHGPHSVSVTKRLLAFTPSILSSMVEKLLWEKKKVRCSLMGYSQGGKTVMGLVHKIPHRIHELFVLAPDGMKNNKIRNFIAKTYIGRKIGLKLVKSPETLHNIIRTLRFMKIITEKSSFSSSITPMISKKDIGFITAGLP